MSFSVPFAAFSSSSSSVCEVFQMMASAKPAACRPGITILTAAAMLTAMFTAGSKTFVLTSFRTVSVTLRYFTYESIGFCVFSSQPWNAIESVPSGYASAASTKTFVGTLGGRVVDLEAVVLGLVHLGEVMQDEPGSRPRCVS